MSLQRRIGRTLIIDNDRCRFSPRIRALKERAQRKRFDHAVDRAAPEGASQSGRFCCQRNLFKAVRSTSDNPSTSFPTIL